MYLEAVLPDGTTRMAKLAQVVTDRAIEGEAGALKELLARLDPVPSHNNVIVNNLITPADANSYIDRLRIASPILSSRDMSPSGTNGNGNGRDH